MKLKKSLYKLIILLGVVFLFTYCDHHLDNHDNNPPSPPENIKTFVGDNLVEITWNENADRDVSGYNIYYATTYWGEYELIGNTISNYFVDYDAKNGDLYYYAVAAYDYDGNESELSYDKVYGVARPEGMNQAIFDYNYLPDRAGYDFSEYLVVPFDSEEDNSSADFFFENTEGQFYLNVWKDTDIQDMGFTQDFTDIFYAPLTGWIQIVENDNVKYTLAEIGNTYVIRTWDNHFAKIRIKSITNERVTFDWGYQLLEGEQQLKTNRSGNKRKQFSKTVIKNKN